MCGRYTLDNPQAIIERFFLSLYDDSIVKLPPRFNIAPGQKAPVVYETDDGKRKADLMRWGLVPSWAKDTKIGYRLINARSESVDEKPSFRSAFKSRRCIIPASGFYEWVSTKSSTNQSIKQPFYIHPKDEKIFALAGLYESWENPETQDVLQTYTILTSTKLKGIHDRMPVILEPDEEEAWLSNLTNHKDLKKLFDPYPEEALQTRKVTTEVNNPKNDHEKLIQPVE
jgi:putative SOS response-associated peptidase YedK